MTKDKLLLTEVRFIEPYLNKVGSKEAGQRWTEVAEHLNSRDGFRENPRDQRSVRERFNKLLNEFKAKTRLEEAASGIAVEPLTENEILLEEIVEIMQSLSSEQTSNTKISESKEREKALKMRDKAMKTWGKTKKDADHSDSDESDEKCVTTPRRKRQRRRGSDALKYLEENAHREAELKKEELAFRKEQAELENKRLQLERTRQEQLQEQAQQQMQQMQQQATLQIQQFNMLQQQMQQQMQMQTTSQSVTQPT